MRLWKNSSINSEDKCMFAANNNIKKKPSVGILKKKGKT